MEGIARAASARAEQAAVTLPPLPLPDEARVFSNGKVDSDNSMLPNPQPNSAAATSPTRQPCGGVGIDPGIYRHHAAEQPIHVRDLVQQQSNRRMWMRHY